MNSTETFVKQRLPDFLREVERKEIGKDVEELNIYEKTLIYYYSVEGYDQLNEDLRDGKGNEYAEHLNHALEKLPDYEGIVFRGSPLDVWEIDVYRKAYSHDTEVTELAFMSCSISVYVAQQFSKGKVIFSIASKTGKQVQQLSFHGYEKEVLFQSQCRFKVVEIHDTDNMTTIYLREI